MASSSRAVAPMPPSPDSAVLNGIFFPHLASSQWRDAHSGLHQLATLSIERRQVHSWLVDLSRYPQPSSGNGLSPPEQQRASRLIFDNDRRRYLVAHGALRNLIACHMRTRSSELEFQTTALGKPYLAPSSSVSCSCRFNMSHSEDLALVVISDDLELGADIEMLRHIDDIKSLAGTVFTRREQAELSEISPNQHAVAFLRGWTRKEACLKAVGCGLGIAPHTFDTGLSDNPATVELETEHGRFALGVRTIDVGPTAIAAIAWIQENPS